MADENISILIEDKVDKSISTKLQGFAEDARKAHNHVEKLQKELNSLKGGALSKLSSELRKNETQILKNSLASQRLATEQMKTAQASAKAKIEQERLTATQTKSEIAAKNLASATQRANSAQLQAQTSAQRLAKAQNDTAAAEKRAEAAASRAAIATLKLEQAQKKAETSSKRLSTAVGNVVRNTAALVGAGLSAQAILKSADAYTVLQNKLQNVSETEVQTIQLTERLFETANKTRTPVLETTQAFTRFDLALKNLGKSQEDSLALTETVNKMLIVSGATSSEAASALLQLSQAFNKGKLDGDEFRSVMELMPNAADAMAQQLGVTRGALIELAPQGKLTSEVMYNAFNKAAKEIDEKFGRTVPTLSQAMTVLRNNATKTFGEFNKAIGFTKGLSIAIIFLANNMKVLGLIAAVTGVALMVAFGPALFGAIRTATSAMIAFTASIAANPIGALIVGITAAISAIVLFGDKIAVSADGVVNLKHVAKAAFSYIKEVVSSAADFIKDVWNSSISIMGETTRTLGSIVKSVYSVVITLTKNTINFYIAAWLSGYNTIANIWNNFPALMKFIFSTVVNYGIESVEKLVNSWQIGLKTIREMTDGLSSELTAKLDSVIESTSIKLPRIEVGEDAKDAGKKIVDDIKTNFTTDYLGNAVNSFMQRARAIAEKEQKSINALRGASDPLNPGGGSKTDKKADQLAKVNAELDNELKRLYMLKPEREAQARLDEIEEKFLSKKIKLSKEELAALKGKIVAIQEAKEVQQAFDSIYEESIGYQTEYNANLKAADKLLNMGAISQEQYNRAVTKATEAYKEASDPLYKYNKALDEELKLLSMLPAQRDIEQQVTQISNELLREGIVLTETETAALREKLSVLQQMNNVYSEEARLLADTVDKRKAFVDQISAIKNLRANQQSGFSSGDEASSVVNMLSEMGLDTSGLQVQTEAYVSQFKEMYDRVNELRSADLISEQEAAGLRAQIWAQQQESQLQTANTFFGHLSALQKSKNDELARIGKAAAITQAMIDTYKSANAAYASMAGIPIVGPALGAAAAGAAIAAGLANVAAIRSQGYKEGGYTGNIGRDEIAGVVHGNEYVFDAESTSRIGVQNLESLRKGASQVKENGANVGKADAAKSEKVVQPEAPKVDIPIKVVNVIDPEEALSALNTSKGEKVVLNIIERNPSSIKTMLNN